MSDGSTSDDSAHGIPDIDRAAQRELLSVYQLARVPNAARHADGMIDREVSDDIARVAASSISDPGKLALLTHLKEQGFEVGDVMPLALALVRRDLTGDKEEHATVLFERIRPGIGDPLGRDPLTYFLENSPTTTSGGAVSTKSDPLIAGLTPSIQNTLMTIVPKCDASRRTANGQRILYVETKVYSNAPIAAFTDIVNPLNWPNCPIQHAFFQKMEILPPYEILLPAPDAGWKGVVRETVNFGPVIGPMTTDLDVRYFHRAPQSGINESVGCTYSFNNSRDKRITFDQGYVLVQDLEASVGARLASSLKEVWFTEEAYNLAPKNICPVWSLATSVILFACLHP